jgi:hypothetical protein
MQGEALQRYRGKGQQKVTVEHAHINTGGQAIVGTIDAPAVRILGTSLMDRKEFHKRKAQKTAPTRARH